MNKFALLFINIFVISVLFSSCDDNTIEVFNTDSVVVQGYLYADNSLDSFRVTKSIGYSETSDEVITFDDLSININDGFENYLLESIGGGYYKNSELIIESGKNYAMEFENNGKTITSETYVPEKKEIAIFPTEIAIQKVYAGVMGGRPAQTDPIVVSWDNTEGEYYYVIVENIETDPEFINENFATAVFERPRIITEPLIISDYNVDTRRDIEFFGTYQVIVYRVNPDYAALYSTSEATSTSLVEPASNIENGLGIMTGISTDTVYFEVTEL